MNEDMQVVILGLVPREFGFTAVCPQVGITVDGATVKEAVHAAQSALHDYLLTTPLPSPGEQIEVPVGTALVIPLLVGHDEQGLCVARVFDMVGVMAVQFVKAAYGGDAATLWDLLSGESRGVWKGIWHGRDGRDLGDLHLWSKMPDTGIFSVLVREITDKLSEAWGPDFNRDDLAPGATDYFSTFDGRVRIVAGITQAKVYREPTEVPAIFIPVVLENGQWRVDYLSMLTPYSML